MNAHVMIIEDDDINCALLHFILDALGCEVVIANNGARGLELARQRTPDLIFCDIQMPVMNGYQTLQHVRADARLAHVPVIAMTALAMRGDREKLLAAGFDGYVGKPFELKEVGHALRVHGHRSVDSKGRSMFASAKAGACSV